MATVEVNARYGVQYKDGRGAFAWFFCFPDAEEFLEKCNIYPENYRVVDLG